MFFFTRILASFTVEPDLHPFKQIMIFNIKETLTHPQSVCSGANTDNRGQYSPRKEIMTPVRLPLLNISVNYNSMFSFYSITLFLIMVSLAVFLTIP